MDKDKDKKVRLIVAVVGWGIIAIVGIAFIVYTIIAFLLVSDINQMLRAPEENRKAAEQASTRIEHYLEKKYDEDFTVLTGVDWIARLEQNRFLIHMVEEYYPSLATIIAKYPEKIDFGLGGEIALGKTQLSEAEIKSRLFKVIEEYKT